MTWNFIYVLNGICIGALVKHSFITFLSNRSLSVVIHFVLIHPADSMICLFSLMSWGWVILTPVPSSDSFITPHYLQYVHRFCHYTSIQLYDKQSITMLKMTSSNVFLYHSSSYYLKNSTIMIWHLRKTIERGTIIVKMVSRHAHKYEVRK